jgi:hypothetical protein
MNIEIMFSDLREPKQQEILHAYGVDNPNEMNWGVIPVSIIEATLDDTT